MRGGRAAWVPPPPAATTRALQSTFSAGPITRPPDPAAPPHPAALATLLPSLPRTLRRWLPTPSPPRPTGPVPPLPVCQCPPPVPPPRTPIMMGFVSSFAGGATLAVRARSALAGRAVAVSPSASARTARWTMVKSKAMPFMEAPPALDGTMAGGTFLVVACRRRPRWWGLSRGGWAHTHGMGGVGRRLPLDGFYALGDDRPLTRGGGGGAAARICAQGAGSSFDLVPSLPRRWLLPCARAPSHCRVDADASCCTSTWFFLMSVTIVYPYSARSVFLRCGLRPAQLHVGV